MRGVLFDMDGVLIHSEEAWFDAMNEVAERLGVPAITRQAFDEGWGAGVPEDAERHYGGVDPDRLEALYTETVPRHLHRLVVVWPEVFEVMDGLGLRVAVVTNTPQPLADQSLSMAGLSPGVVCAAGDAEPKPAPDLILLALRRLGLRPDEVVMVGDSAFDARAAAAAGVRLVGVGQPGWRRVESIRELPGLDVFSERARLRRH